MTNNSLFLSYRRANGFAWARLVWEEVSARGIDVFLDLESIRDAGHFDQKILNQIEARPYFAPLLVPGSLERCADPDDWFRREIDHAVATDRAIVPLVVGGFDFDEAERCLTPPTCRAVRTSNGVHLVAEYFGEAMDRLCDERLKPIDRSVRSLSEDDEAFAAHAHRLATQVTADLPAVVPGTTKPGRTTPEPTAPEPAPDASRELVGDAERSEVEPVLSASSPWRGRRSLVVVAVGVIAALAAVVLDSDRDAPRAVGMFGVIATSTTSTTSSTTTTPVGPTTLPAIDELGSVIGPDRANHLDDPVRPGQVLRSDLGGHELVLRPEDGALVMSTDGVDWAPGLQPARDGQRFVNGGAYWKMQGDGNLVVYSDPDGDLDRDESVERGPDVALWSTGTADLRWTEPPHEVRLVLEDVPGTGFGRLEIRVDDEALWTCRSDECPVRDEPVSTEPTLPTTTEGPVSTSGTVSTDPPDVTTSQPEPLPTTVPSVEGLSYPEAEAQLAAAGLVAERDDVQTSGDLIGRVVAQSVQAGAVAEQGATIVLTVGSG